MSRKFASFQHFRRADKQSTQDDWQEKPRWAPCSVFFFMSPPYIFQSL